MSQQKCLDFYSQPGIITDLAHGSQSADQLAEDIPTLVQQIQGLIIHVFWFERMGIQIPEQRKEEVNLRFPAQQLDRILELNDSPLDIPRPGEERLIGNCRDFSTFTAAVLRQKGIPARARCGFGRYFLPDHYEDHWVCEVWDSAAKRWKLVDSQLDAFQCEQLNVSFSTLDVPREEFITAGQAWKLCRSGEVDPEKFGIFDMHGLWFVRGNVIRDFLSLNKIELLPWDAFGLISRKDSELIQPDLNLLDTIADLTTSMDSSFPEIRALLEDNEVVDPADLLAGL